jgi:hypothetical protein
MSEMNVASNAGPELRMLRDDELDEVNGGFIWIAAVAGGFAAGVGIRWAADKVISWLF